jgi:hypothetical protein
MKDKIWMLRTSFKKLSIISQKWTSGSQKVQRECSEMGLRTERDPHGMPSFMMSRRSFVPSSFYSDDNYGVRRHWEDKMSKRSRKSPSDLHLNSVSACRHRRPHLATHSRSRWSSSKVNGRRELSKRSSSRYLFCTHFTDLFGN